jgi:FSR family fosmidomycin resistance protein-like MFS transporter
VVSLMLGGVLFLGFLVTSGIVSLILLALSGTVLYASWSVIIVMASEAAPRNVGAVSGFMLGFAVGIGGLAALGLGTMADHIGLQLSFAVFTGFAFAGGLLGAMIPKQRGAVYSTAT